MKNEMALRDLGRAFANEANEFLLEKYGSQVELGELSAFYAAGSSWMVAKAFALLFRKAGPQEAEAFLRNVLSGISASVRLQKIPVMVNAQATLELTEGEAVLEEPEAQPPPPAAAAPAATEELTLNCGCKLKNGACAECAAKTASRYRDLADYLLVYMKTMAEKTQELGKDCPACAAQYSDIAISAIAHDASWTKKEPKELVEQMLGALIQVAQGVFGVTELPLTEKVLDSKPGAT